MDFVLDISGVEGMQGRSVLGVLWMIGIYSCRHADGANSKVTVQLLRRVSDGRLE